MHGSAGALPGGVAAVLHRRPIRGGARTAGQGNVGHFAERRRTDVRFEEYARHLLRLSTGTFLQDETWLDFVVSRAAIIRAATGLPPLHKAAQELGGGEELDSSHAIMLIQFTKAFPKKSFSFRYLLGDKEFYGLAMLIMHQMTAEQRADVFNKE